MAKTKKKDKKGKKGKKKVKPGSLPFKQKTKFRTTSQVKTGGGKNQTHKPVSGAFRTQHKG